MKTRPIKIRGRPEVQVVQAITKSKVDRVVTLATTVDFLRKQGLSPEKIDSLLKLK